MRKYHKQLILELLDSVKEEWSNERYAEAEYGLQVIQGFIQDNGVNNPKLDLLLDDYLSLLEQATQKRNARESLLKHSSKTEKIFGEELRADKIDVVFLSYKKAMSDSIESIYLAAKEDPACNAIWMPIPYFEKNPDGSFGEAHYEGAEFYDEKFTVTDWRAYDIEQNHPEVIITFAPYDNYNYVTSVHPNFYCERLRKLTDMLVYVPYFVSTGDVVAEHFCTVAGCAFAHRVILQSEKIKETYVRVFKETYGELFGNPEDKFVVLGSPKFDKVLSTKREDCDLPEEWRQLIGNKKVILYNTTVTAVIRGQEQYLKKVRSVLEEFCNRKDVVLWWRPHPLFENTLKSMRPELLEEYHDIVKQYREEGYGIFDTSADLNRSIAISDAYYGDSSSVVELYHQAGKIALEQNIGLTDYNYRYVSYAMYYDGEFIWSTAFDYNGLFKMNPHTFSVEFVGHFPKEEKGRIALFDQIVECNGKLYFVPKNADNVGVYDKGTDRIYQLSLKPQWKGMNRKFLGAVVYGKYVYIGAGSVFTICCIDTETDEVEYIDHWTKVVLTEGIKAEKGTPEWIMGRGTVVGDSIYYPATYANSILQMNGANGEYKLYPSEVGELDCFAVDNVCEELWLAPRSGKYPITKFNLTSKKYNRVSKPEFQINGTTAHLVANQNVYYFPPTECAYIKIDTNSMKAEKFVLDQAGYIYAACRVNESIIMMSHATGILYEIDISNDCIKRKENLYLKNADSIFKGLQFPDMTRESKAYYKNSRAHETGILNLRLMLDAELSDLARTQEQGTAGKQIYQYIAERVL